ncbi:MAG: hypothetical protein IPM61_01140 [Chlorobi bacterium]|nr:hypothetical protein [Chlorobiota bacterium]
MVKIKAKIRLNNKRQTPFRSGYWPTFNFIDNMKTGGRITLIHKDEFFPGEEGIVEITFINDRYLGGEFRVGAKFTFDEGSEVIGEGIVVQILSMNS